MQQDTSRSWKALLWLLWAAAIAAAMGSPWLAPAADAEDLATRQTARVAVLFWGLAATWFLWPAASLTRWTWTLAWAAYVVHVAVAFDHVHHWSHAAAYLHVQEVSGFGPGIFVSYAFSVLWSLDVAWWWLSPRTYETRSAWVDRLLHGFFAFIVFNGMVVYEDGIIRWAGIVLFSWLGCLFLRRLRNGRKVSGFHFLA